MNISNKISSFVLLICVFAVIFLSWGCSSPGKVLGFQLEQPQEGEQVAILDTTMGSIKVRLFPEFAPKAVENFTTLAKQGYYNGLKFHRVIEGFCVQGGDPNGDGTGGQSIWGKGFEVESCEELVNITGALSMARSSSLDSNGSQFFFNQGGTEAFSGWDTLNSIMNKSRLSEEYKKIYNENGGNPSLDGYYNKSGEGYTVFGQIYDGLDVLNKIAKVKIDSYDRPVEDVVINSITISEI